MRTTGEPLTAQKAKKRNEKKRKKRATWGKVKELKKKKLFHTQHLSL